MIIENIEPETKIINPGKTILEQVLEAPEGSVITVSQERYFTGAYDVLMRTGIDGWLTARKRSNTHGNIPGYLNKGDVAVWVAENERAKRSFDLVVEGGRH